MVSVLVGCGGGHQPAAQASTRPGILGGRLYLTAYGLRLRATGSTFYDDEVSEFSSPHGRGKSPVLAIGIGKDARRFRQQSAVRSV